MSKLSILALALGLAIAIPQAYGLLNPAGYTAAVRKFPRSYAWGVALMLLGTVWFLWNVGQESIADLVPYKSFLIMGFAAIGIGSCIFVRDFLAVRGLAVVFLLFGKLMVDTGRPFLDETAWTLLIQTMAYVLVFAGMWLTISPWRLRDLIDWGTATQQRLKTACAVKVGFGVVLALLGLIKFR